MGSDPCSAAAIAAASLAKTSGSRAVSSWRRAFRDTSNDGGTSNNDRTSAMYMKFDISSITPAQLASHQSAALRLTIRNTNLNWSRLYALNPYYGPNMQDQTNNNPDFVAFRDNINNWTRARFNLWGLKPEGMDAADPRRFGNADPNLPVPNYNWIEHVSANGDPCPETGNGCGATINDPQSRDETTWDAVRSPLIGPIGPITWYNAAVSRRIRRVARTRFGKVQLQQRPGAA